MTSLSRDRITWIFIFLMTLFLGCNQYDADVQVPPEDAIACSNAVTGEWVSLGLESEEVTSIAVHPTQSGIIYAGTGFDFSGGVIGKLMKTTNCGQTWDTLLVGRTFAEVLFKPDHPSTIFAMNTRLWKSSDNGQTWDTSDDGIGLGGTLSVSTMAIRPDNPEEMYVGTVSNFGGGLYKSINGGKSWRMVKNKGLDQPSLNASITAIAINPLRTDQILVGIAGFEGLVHSSDDGSTWSTTNLPDFGRGVMFTMFDPQSESAYAGINRTGLFRSIGDLNSWEQIASDSSFGSTITPAQMVVDPNDGSRIGLFTGVEGGLIFSQRDGGEAWSAFPQPHNPHGYFYAALVIKSQQSFSELYLGDHGVFRMIR